MRTTVRRGLLAILLLALAGCGSGGGDDRGASPPDASEPGTEASAGRADLAGTWGFRLEGPRINQGTGSYAGATVTVSDNRLVVRGPADARSETPLGYLAGEQRITCRADLCVGPGALPFGFQAAGTGFRAVSPVTLAPHNAGAGGTCNAPAVGDAGLVRDFDGNSFSFLAGLSGGAGTSCYQVLFTLRATRQG